MSPPGLPLFPYTSLFRSVFYEGLTGAPSAGHFHGNALIGAGAGVKVPIAIGPSPAPAPMSALPWKRSEEHTSELQTLRHLVCRLLLEKKRKTTTHHTNKR